MNYNASAPNAVSSEIRGFDLSPNARCIASDAEAIAVASQLADEFRVEAAQRDRERRLPAEELDRFSGSGLWAITVPKAYGGAGVSFATLAEVIAVISAADPNLGQLPWSGFGQRTTGSGTTVLKDVPVHPFSILSFSALFDRPTAMGPFAQIMHAAVEQGIAEAALADTVQFVRTSARPYKDARVERASDDPYTVATAGELKIRVDASSALLARAGSFVDRAQAEPSFDTVAAASVAVAESKIASTEAALLVASKLIGLAGSSATLTKHGLDRHWRNARTHTVHDPVRWKYRAVGDYWLNSVNPSRHGAI